MTRLNQVVALENGAKGEAERARETAKAKLRLTDKMKGLTRSYEPRQENGEQLPPESTEVQLTVRSILADALPSMRRLFDLTATKERANQEAVADVVVDGLLRIEGLPVTVLLFLEKQLRELSVLVAGIPVLDPAEVWEPHEPGIYRTRPRQTTRPQKIPKAFVKYEATKEHPAQVDVYTEDKVIGDWTKIEFSGAIQAADKAEMIERLRRLTAAVLVAREEANSIGVTDRELGEKVLDYLFAPVS